MTFIEAFDKIKASLKGAKADEINGHLAIQINLNNPDSSGIFYIEINDGNVYVEPFDYYDRDAMFIVSCEDFIDIMTGVKEFEDAIADGSLVIEGNFDRALEMKKLVVKAKKAPAKKSSAKKPAAKASTKKKAEAKEDTKKAVVKEETKKAPKKAAAKTEEKKETKSTAKKTTKKSAKKEADDNQLKLDTSSVKKITK